MMDTQTEKHTAAKELKKYQHKIPKNDFNFHLEQELQSTRIDITNQYE